MTRCYGIISYNFYYELWPRPRECVRHVTWSHVPTVWQSAACLFLSYNTSCSLKNLAFYLMGSWIAFFRVKTVGAWSSPPTSIQCRGSHCLELYFQASCMSSYCVSRTQQKIYFQTLLETLLLVWIKMYIMSNRKLFLSFLGDKGDRSKKTWPPLKFTYPFNE